MYNFGDELSIQSYRVPWLIWIQLIVMVLLLLLLYCFSLLVIDLSENDGSSSSNSNSNFNSRLVPTSTTVSANRLQNTQVRESMKGEIVPSTSRVMRAEDMVEMEGSGAPNIYLHPCHYFRLARLAFLKCLGLDPAGENSSNLQRGKRKES